MHANVGILIVSAMLLQTRSLYKDGYWVHGDRVAWKCAICGRENSCNSIKNKHVKINRIMNKTEKKMKKNIHRKEGVIKAR
jgi:hypothetical protein